jgi:hypothetical protein
MLAIYRLARELRVQDGNIHQWLSRLPLSELLGWIAYMELEPLTPERDDMRMGALLALMRNLNVDTQKYGWSEPLNYVSGQGKDNVYFLGYHKKPIEQWDADKVGSDSDRTLNNPRVWDEFKGTLISLAKGQRKP